MQAAANELVAAEAEKAKWQSSINEVCRLMILCIALHTRLPQWSIKQIKAIPTSAYDGRQPALPICTVSRRLLANLVCVFYGEKLKYSKTEGTSCCYY